MQPLASYFFSLSVGGVGVFLLSGAAMLFSENLSIYLEWQIFLDSKISFKLPFYFDLMSCIFLSTVSVVSCSVFTFSGYYMSAEKHKSRFFFLMFLFILSMFVLLLTPNLLVIFLGWDGLGVSSFLLVVYYQKSKSVLAGVLTILTNRIGDVLLVISVGLLSCVRDHSFFFANYYNLDFAVLLSLLVIVASFTKSAQVPFSAWLPAAMAAPTPVSALVHSSTLVTAGVYILIRSGDLFLSADSPKILLIAGAITSASATLYALWELDLKKIVAWSTLSQLGLMFMALGVGEKWLSFFHLVSHAFFKALLFVIVGHAIHVSQGYQDLRLMSLGGYHKTMLAIMVVSSFSLSGVPFMTGFYSKDFLLETGVTLGESVVLALCWGFSVFGTAFYCTRLFLGLWGTPKKMFSVSGSTEWDTALNASCSILVLPSVLFGAWGILMGVFFSPTPFLSSSMKIFFILCLLSGVLISALLSEDMIRSKTWVLYVSSVQKVSWMSSPLVSKSVGVFSNFLMKLEQAWVFPLFLTTQPGGQELVWWERSAFSLKMNNALILLSLGMCGLLLV